MIENLIDEISQPVLDVTGKMLQLECDFVRDKNKLIKEMNSMAELEEYIDKTEDVQLGMMVEIVNEYGNEIPGIIKTIKEKHIKDEEKEQKESA